VDAVLFDLFGTLVPPYRRAAHEATLGRIADVLGAPEDEVFAGWSDTWEERASGGFRSIRENLAAIVPAADPDSLTAAEDVYHEFTVHTLEAKPGAFEILDWLRERGVATALVTNCAPDVPALWHRTEWEPRFDAVVFSCAFGARKPAAGVYEHALGQVQVPADRAVFVGDGSDRELMGAAAIGMAPVLVRNDGDTDDAAEQRHDDGGVVHVAAVDHLHELRAVLASMR
jgi:putative hydrolase of the HAD superfamily